MPAVSHHHIAAKINKLATHITQLHFKNHQDLFSRYGEAGKLRCHEDAVFNLEFLVVAMEMDNPEMYAKYIAWAAAMLSSRNIPSTDLANNLDYLQQSVQAILGKEAEELILPYIKMAKENLNQGYTDFTAMEDDNPLQAEADQYLEMLLEGQKHEATKLIHGLIDKGTTVPDIYEHIFQYSQYKVGVLWQNNEISVAHEHYCTAATQVVMSSLYNYLNAPAHNGKTLVACSVSGDQHEMGIRMVADLFEIEGWKTFYLGANMPTRQLQESLIEHVADVLAVSVTLPTHLSALTHLLADIRNNDKLADLKILVGGYPFLNNPGLWQKVGADGFAESAIKALALANELTDKAGE